MLTLKKIEQKGNAAVKELRHKKLQNGMPFMINSGELQAGQCYLEYPEGIIKLVRIEKSSRNFHVIRELSQIESKNLLVRYSFDKF